mmetsp:Transcript_8314/g.25997  ORF Transcript_8314/g.25997 Transcript_8314/m.25997 type:complete len:623 (-) Transcript_8314:124-1992(-)
MKRLLIIALGCAALLPPLATRTRPARRVALHAKKGKKENKFKKSTKQPKQQEKKAAQEERFDAVTRQYMFTLAGLNKKTPDGSRTILDNVDLCFFPGAKIGVVGQNGAGKSTLMKIMAGVDDAFDGEARPAPGASVGYLPQEPTLEGETVDDAIAPAIAKARGVLERFETLSAELATMEGDALDEAMAELGRIQDEIDAGDLWDLDRRVDIAINALRCPPRDAKTAVLSGGEARRVALCRLLLEGHDLLLLDEPTNHLDAESVLWLERYLAEFKGTVVTITHDRYFLENISEWILELDNGKGYPFEGSYAEWLASKAARRAESKRAADNASRAADKELEWLRSAKAASKNKARLKSYDALVDAAQTADDAAVGAGAIWIPPGPRLGEDVISAEHLSKTIGDRVLIDDLSLEIPRASVVGIVGANGAGKSTLVKMLSGVEAPTSGEVRVGGTVKLATVDQARDDLDAMASKTVFEAIAGEREKLELGDREVNARAYVSAFGFRSREQSKKIGDLSGGERNRAHLAALVKEGANVLVLDEPTNDLDVGTLRALEEAILGFAGTVLVVSHDRYFLDRVATHIVSFEGDAHVEFFNGNWAEYAEDRIRRGLGDEVSNFKYRKLVEA